MYVIRKMREADRSGVLDMMREFYSSPAVLSNGSEDIFNRDFDNCVGECPYIEGYVFQSGGIDGSVLQGYAMTAKSFSAEFGKPCIWIEDLYIKSDFRGVGIGGGFLDFIENKYPEAVIRLEVELDNKRAIKVYKAHGYKMLAYNQMIKITD